MVVLGPEVEGVGAVSRRFLRVVLALALLSAVAPVSVFGQSVVPADVSVELEPGQSMVIDKEVTTPEIPPTPDIYFLADATGSMGGSLSAVKADAESIIADILALDPDSHFGVGNYLDFPYDPYAFQHQQSITGDSAAVVAAIDAWTLGGGGDGPEGQFYALYRIATDPAIGWRTNTSRILVWFGDAPGHDPIPQAASGLDFDITEERLISALVSAGIRVIAVSVTSGYPLGLDDDPGGAGDYSIYPDYVAGGSPGQATRIAAATGGAHLTGVAPAAVVEAILAGITDIRTDVWATVDADPGLTLSFDPALHAGVGPGDTVEFEETISVDADAPTGTELTATVTFWAGSYPSDGAVLGEQTVTVTVPASLAPTPTPTAGPSPASTPGQTDVVTPGLPRTGLGPDRPVPGYGILVLGLTVGALTYAVRRRSAVSAD